MQMNTSDDKMRRLLLSVVVVILSTLLNGMFDDVHVHAVRNIQVVFPLQSLTIWDPEVMPQQDPNDAQSSSSSSSSNTSFRAKFIKKFQKGLQAEVTARNTLQLQELQQQQQLTVDTNGSKQSNKNNKSNWAMKAAQIDRTKHETREAMIETAYDDAIRQAQRDETNDDAANVALRKTMMRRNPNKYQFVGVITNVDKNHRQQKEKPIITWYTRNKPKNAKWTMRLVHVNRAAILKDLYDRKKIDVFVQYHNENSSKQENGGGGNADSGWKPTVTGRYHIRERSWKNLWNMSLKHMLTDSSGMYWRERRIASNQKLQQQMLYTDGQTVYAATYRYIPDGRNGMHKVSTLQEFLNSRSIDNNIKQSILNKLRNDVPDVVLEE